MFVSVIVGALIDSVLVSSLLIVASPVASVMSRCVGSETPSCNSFDRVTEKVSLFSTRASSLTVTVIVFEVSPGANVSVPVCAV